MARHRFSQFIFHFSFKRQKYFVIFCQNWEISTSVSGPRLRRRGLTPKQCSFAHVSPQWGDIFSKIQLQFFTHTYIFIRCSWVIYNTITYYNCWKNALPKCSCIKKMPAMLQKKLHPILESQLRCIFMPPPSPLPLFCSGYSFMNTVE